MTRHLATAITAAAIATLATIAATALWSALTADI